MYLLSGGPVLGSKRHGLGEKRDDRAHDRLLQMSQVHRIALCVMNEVLIEEDRVEWRDQLYGHKELAGSQVLGLVSEGGMAAEPLQQSLVVIFMSQWRCQLIGDVGLFLTGMGWSKLFRELVCLDHLDVGQLESYLRCQWTDAPLEGSGCLIAGDVVAVQSLPCRGFVHFCHVGRDIFLLSASWTSFLHLRAPRSVLTYACKFVDESSSVYWN